MTKAQVVVITNVPGVNPIAFPVEADTLDECYEEVDGFFYFPDKQNALGMINRDCVAGMVRQELSQVVVPEKNVRFPGR